MVVILGWIATITVLISYFLIPTRGSRQFDWANLACFMPIALSALIARAYPSMVISVFFGVIAISNLFRKPPKINKHNVLEDVR